MAQIPTQNHCEMCMNACGNDYCLDCNQYFCHNCKTSHLRIAVCKNHRFKSSGLATSDPNVFCQDHNDSFVFICDECQLPVCRQCTVKTHRGHLMADIAETVASRKSDFLSSIRSTLEGDDAKHLDDVARHIDDRISKLDVHEAETVRDIREDGEAIKSTIDNIVKELEKDLINQTTERKKELKKSLQETQKTKDLMTNMRSKEQEIRTSRETIALLGEMKQLEGTFSKLKIPDVQEPSVVFYRAAQRSSDAVRDLMGRLVISVVKPIIVQKEKVLSGQVFDRMLSHGTQFRNGFQQLTNQLKIKKVQDDNQALIAFYRIQTVNKFNTNCPKKVNILLEFDEDSPWQRLVTDTTAVLGQAAPGLEFYFVREQSEADILVRENTAARENTRIYWEQSGETYKAIISLCARNSVRTSMLSTICMLELLYALGFHYKMMQLFCTLASLSDGSADHQTIQRFDPYSLLLFGSNVLIDDSTWELHIRDVKSINLSEMDKVMLNLLFPPCLTKSYNPQLSDVTSMLYCGRRVMEDHNRPERSHTDGRCGPTNGANCPACRTLIEPKKNKIASILAGGRFQGWSGDVYCYKQNNIGPFRSAKTRMRVCGPNFGEPCSSCYGLIL